jgi:hypothetical protein
MDRTRTHIIYILHRDTEAGQKTNARTHTRTHNSREPEADGYKSKAYEDCFHHTDHNEDHGQSTKVIRTASWKQYINTEWTLDNRKSGNLLINEQTTLL